MLRTWDTFDTAHPRHCLAWGTETTTFVAIASKRCVNNNETINFLLTLLNCEIMENTSMSLVVYQFYLSSRYVGLSCLHLSPKNVKIMPNPMCCRRWPTPQRQINYLFSIESSLDSSNGIRFAELWTEKSFRKTSTESYAAFYGFGQTAFIVYTPNIWSAQYETVCGMLMWRPAQFIGPTTTTTKTRNTRQRFLSGQWVFYRYHHYYDVKEVSRWIGSHYRHRILRQKLGQSQTSQLRVVYFRLVCYQSFAMHTRSRVTYRQASHVL